MLASRLKEIRIGKGLNQTQAAEKLGISRVNYNRYENGEREPDNETISKIADFFAVSTDYLLGRENRFTATFADKPPDEQQLVADQYISDLIAYYECTAGKERAAAKLRSMDLSQQRQLADRFSETNLLTDPGIEYELLSQEDTINQFKSLPVETQEALAKIIHLLARSR